MKKNLLALLFTLSLTIIAKPQEFSRTFGEIGTAEINLKTYSKDPLAEAVVLFDIGDSRFIDVNDGYNIQFVRARRIKILSNEGVSYSEVSLPYYIENKGRTEEIRDLKAVSYNIENGKVIASPLDPSTVYDETISKEWRAKKFVFPNVKEGTIIEYQYTLITPFMFNLPSWKFQSRIPTVYSRYTVRMIPFYEYSFLLQGISRFDYTTSTVDTKERTFGQVSEFYGQTTGNGVKFKDMIHVYGMNNVAAFRDESYITSPEDYLIKINFQLSRVNNPYTGVKEDVMTTWPKIIKELLQNDYFGRFMNSCGRLASKILETNIDLKDKTDEEKFRNIVKYVKTSYKWDDFQTIYSSKNARDFTNQKNGNSAEINLFLTALLNEAGFKAYPVIISTRDHGRIARQFPFLHFFNTVIVLAYIGEKPVLCDGSDYFTQYNRIPPDCINDQGLVVMNGAENWVNLNMGLGSVDEKTVMMDVKPDVLKTDVKVTLNASEYDAYYYRKTFLNDTSKLKELFTQSGFSTVSGINTLNFDNIERPYSIVTGGESDLEQLGDNIIISPFLHFYPIKNKLTQAERSYPVDLTYSNTESYKCTVNIPQGYKIATLPEVYNLDNDLVKISLAYESSQGVITMVCSYGFKKAVYLPADYKNIKSYFDIIVKKFNEKIVLVKA